MGGRKRKGDASKIREKKAAAPVPAFKQITVGKFPESYSREKVMSEMKKIADTKFPSYPLFCIDLHMKGPQDNRVPNGGAFFEFATSDTGKAVAKTLGKNCRVKLDDADSTEVTVRPTKTKLDGHRDYILAAACDRIKAHPSSKGKDVKIEGGSDRTVNVNGVTSFKQPGRKSTDDHEYYGVYKNLEILA